VTTPSLARQAGSSPAPIAIAERVATLDWAAISARLDASGCATTGAVLAPAECAALAQTYDADAHFRSRVVMARHGFGSGEYKYFSYPLPDLVAELREALYPRLAEIADRWNEAMDVDVRYPRVHADYLKRCHRGGQTKPTPLLLARPGADFTGGEFVLTEQRPRMQSRAEVVQLVYGEAVIFPVHHRPVRGTRGIYRVNMRHGVSRVRSGRRHTLGVIFHDAK
jgi:hypothetical protein